MESVQKLRTSHGKQNKKLQSLSHEFLLELYHRGISALLITETSHWTNESWTRLCVFQLIITSQVGLTAAGIG